MKTLKNSLILLFFALAFTNAQGQDHILTPSDADIIVSMRGGNLFDKVSLEDMKATPILNEMFVGLTQMAGVENGDIDNLGIDLDSDAQYFLKFNDDGNILMGTSFKVDSPEQFSKVFLSSGTIQEKNGVSFVIVDGYTRAMKGNQGLVTYSVMAPNHEVEESYYNYDEEISIEDSSDWSNEEEWVEEMPDIEEEAMDAIEDAKDAVEEIEEYAPEEAEIDEWIVEEEPAEIDYYAHYEEERRIENEKIGIVSQGFAMKLFATPPSINDFSAKKIDKTADFSILVNSYTGFYKYFSDEAYPSYYYRDPFETEMSRMLENMYKDFEWLSMNGYFDKDELRVESHSKFQGELAKWYGDILDADFNPKMMNFIPFDDHISYIAGAYNTEAAINGYYNYTRNILNNLPKSEDMDNVAANVSIGLDFMEMFIDEAALAKLCIGDFYMGITDINSYEVEYTTYEYDDNWDYKEVTKTKEEVRPDFLVMFSSEDEKNINNIFKMIEINSGGMFVKTGDYYKMESSREIPLDLYAMQKDGVVFIFTSQGLFNFISKGGKKPSAENKSLINDHSTILNVNGSKLAEKIPLTDLPSDLLEVVTFMRDNSGNLSVKQHKLKDNILSAEMTMTVKGDHKNSLSYFIHLMDEIYNISNNQNTYRN